MRSARRVARLALAAAFLQAGCLPADWGARAIVRPFRRAVTLTPDLPHEQVTFTADDVVLRGWLFRGRGVRRGLIVYLHGIADTRQSGLGLARRFVPLGYDVLLYDLRAHGASGGEYCTYGVRERRDLSRALDAVGARAAILIGVSLGGAIALQAAAHEPRVEGVVALAAFSDLESVVRDRSPWLASDAERTAALAEAGRLGRFDPREASPVRAAPRIKVPVLLIHGARDWKTPPHHSRRIFEALPGPKSLRVIDGAGHDDILARAESWRAIDDWLSARERP